MFSFFYLFIMHKVTLVAIRLMHPGPKSSLPYQLGTPCYRSFHEDRYFAIEQIKPFVQGLSRSPGILEYI